MKTKTVLSGFIAAVCLAASAFLTTGAPPAKTAVSRPPILGIANVALRVSNADEAHHFFGQVLGFDRLPLKETAKGKMKYAYYKVNDYQYIKVSPTQTSPSEDGMIHIAYPTRYLGVLGRTYALDTPEDLARSLLHGGQTVVGQQLYQAFYLPVGSAHQTGNRT